MLVHLETRNVTDVNLPDKVRIMWREVEPEVEFDEEDGTTYVKIGACLLFPEGQTFYTHIEINGFGRVIADVRHCGDGSSKEIVVFEEVTNPTDEALAYYINEAVRKIEEHINLVLRDVGPSEEDERELPWDYSDHFDKD